MGSEMCIRDSPLGTGWRRCESVEGVGKAVGFFSLLIEGIEKSCWEISPTPLETLEKVVGFFPLTR